LTSNEYGSIKHHNLLIMFIIYSIFIHIIFVSASFLLPRIASIPLDRYDEPGIRYLPARKICYQPSDLMDEELDTYQLEKFVISLVI